MGESDSCGIFSRSQRPLLFVFVDVQNQERVLQKLRRDAHFVGDRKQLLKTRPKLGNLSARGDRNRKRNHNSVGQVAAYFENRRRT